MLKGIGGIPYIDLDKFLDIDGFRKLHPEICKGFALAREYAKEGTWMTPSFDLNDASYITGWKPIYKALNEFNDLPDDNPIKIAGKELYPTNFKDFKQRNLFVRFLKSAMGCHDPYMYYFLWEDANNMSDRGEVKRPPTIEQQYFPNVVKWVEKLIDDNIIEYIGRVIFFVSESGTQPFEHRDIDYSITDKDENGYSDHRIEFIHIRPITKRGFYIWDPEEKRKHYVNSHAAFFNDQDWHGGEFSFEQEYSLRIDCKFTEDFRKKIGIDHLENY